MHIHIVVAVYVPSVPILHIRAHKAPKPDRRNLQTEPGKKHGKARQFVRATTVKCTRNERQPTNTWDQQVNTLTSISLVKLAPLMSELGPCTLFEGNHAELARLLLVVHDTLDGSSKSPFLRSFIVSPLPTAQTSLTASPLPPSPPPPRPSPPAERLLLFRAQHTARWFFKGGFRGLLSGFLLFSALLGAVGMHQHQPFFPVVN